MYICYMVSTDNKLNNYHFGRHVFEYFPWYTYDNKDITKLPILNGGIFNAFSSAFGDFDQLRTIWVPEREYSWVCVGSGFGSEETLIFRDKKISYNKIEEDISDWEDIEKIRLRYVIGTKEKADVYFRVIELYNKYYDDLNDMMYTQTGEDYCDVSIVNIRDFIMRDSNRKFCINFIKDKDVYDIFDKDIPSQKLVSSDVSWRMRSSQNFIESIYSYYKKNGHLTEKQMLCIKDVLYKKILKDKNDAFFYLKLNKVKNLKRIEDFIIEIGMKYTDSEDDGLLVYV